MANKITVELDKYQVEWIIRHIKNTISQLEKYGTNIPIRKKRLAAFRAWLQQLEQEQQ